MSREEIAIGNSKVAVCGDGLRCVVVRKRNNAIKHICTLLLKCGYRTRCILVSRPKWRCVDAHIIIYDVTAESLDLASDPFVRQLPWLPRIALVGEGASVPVGFDDSIAIGEDPAGIRAKLDFWGPADAADFHRVVHAFGADAIRPVARGLSEELQRAIAEFDANVFDRAHRIAGLAGTMGFARVSTAWNALSLGNMAEAPGARREARLAVATIERWLAG